MFGRLEVGRTINSAEFSSGERWRAGPVGLISLHYREHRDPRNDVTPHSSAAKTEGTPEQVLKQAQAAAGGRDVKINGGVATIRAFWKARLLDELHLAMAPVFVGEGERLLGGLGVEQDYQVVGFEASEAAVHYRIAKKK